ncbi:RNA polymerase sigma factor (sigma-70 family) [Paenarthrobacter ilicis]|uniref:RNA polymerase sigma factor (Sigma-70 family) n=1 Tax=Paenarthrobacter ilicis TaxID=43665 RepID=A0ABX0TMP1_9MICC|nr:sigma-70 family RNA polymerase sigma factor [Paenarthrobacter ilicis]NIJ03429.1 RNA polymerase sigma factor (sigma-70 family) [Paenarthrobacter ilicis]
MNEPTQRNPIDQTRPAQQLRAAAPEPPETLTDTQLLRAARSGNMDAYAQIYTRHKPLALTIAGSILRNRDQAEDVASEAFRSILAAIQAGSGPTDSFKGYLRTTVTNAAHKMSRQTSGETLVEAHPEHLHPVEDPTANINDPAVLQAFSSLPRKWQMVLWYLDIHGYKPKDVAATFDLTPNALVSLHRRAKKGLAAAYTQTTSLES